MYWYHAKRSGFGKLTICQCLTQICFNSWRNVWKFKRSYSIDNNRICEWKTEWLCFIVLSHSIVLKVFMKSPISSLPLFRFKTKSCRCNVNHLLQVLGILVAWYLTTLIIGNLSHFRRAHSLWMIMNRDYAITPKVCHFLFLFWKCHFSAL